MSPRRDEDEAVELEVTVRAKTAKAIMISCEAADVDEQWIPLSCVTWEKGDVELKRGETGTLHVAKWFAKREGLSDD